MPAFVLGRPGEYTWPVEFLMEEGGKMVKRPMMSRFRETTQADYEAFTREVRELGVRAEAGDPEVAVDWCGKCREVVAGWEANGKVFLDEDGNPAVFTPENLEDMITGHAMVAQIIAEAWLESVLARRTKTKGGNAGREGNSKGRSFTG